MSVPIRALIAIAALIAIVIVVGYALPVAHVATREATIPAPPDKVFAAIADVDRYAAWRADVASVDVVSRAPALRWVETDRRGDKIAFEVVESQPPLKRVTRIADPSLPFGGTWTYELRADGAGTLVVITEHGEVYNPVFRFMSRFVFGHTSTMETFLNELRSRAVSAP